MEIWGTGSPRRELLHVDDLADACVMLLETYSGAEHVNVGSGVDLTILELAESVKQAVGFEGEIVTDPNRPDGTPRKLMSAAKLRAMGWIPSIPLADGIVSTYEWFLANVAAQERA
jgi:GDP-L-fucose synthase